MSGWAIGEVKWFGTGKMTAMPISPGYGGAYFPHSSSAYMQAVLETEQRVWDGQAWVSIHTFDWSKLDGQGKTISHPVPQSGSDMG